MKNIKQKILVLAALGIMGNTVTLANETDNTLGTVEFSRGNIEIGGPNGGFAPSIDFGVHEITSVERNYDGVASSPLTVTDNRGTEEGWKVTVRQSTEFSNGVHTLVGSEIRIGSINGMASFLGSNIVLSPSNAAHVVAVANVETGAGINNFELNNIILNLPTGLVTLASSYQADLVWTVANVPTP